MDNRPNPIHRSAHDERLAIRNPRLILLAIVVAACGAVFVAGLFSDVSLGDENHHVGFARAMHEAGQRVTHNPLYPSSEPPGYPYAADFLWPAGLALLWRAAAPPPTDPPMWLAQLYQAGFLALLLVSINWIARRLFDARAALWSVALAASIPMVGSFSVMLYVDVPAAALVAAAGAAVVSRRAVVAGLLVGAAYLTKQNTLFLFPLLLIWTWQFAPNIKRFALRAALMGMVAALPVYWNITWLATNVYTALPGASPPASGSHVARRLTTFWTTEFLPSRLTNPIDLVTYLGLALFVALAVCIALKLWGRVRPETPNRVFLAEAGTWIGLGVALLATLALFTLNTDVRYTMPLVPLIALPLGRAVSALRCRYALAALAVLCAAQLGGASVYTAVQRRIPAETRRAYVNLRQAIAQGAYVVNPEEAFMFHARRPIVWAHLTDPRHPGQRGPQRLFWPEPDTPERIGELLRHNRVAFVLVARERVFDDSGGQRHVGGFPASFVERLPALPFLTKVEGDWPGFELWQVRPLAGGGAL